MIADCDVDHIPDALLDQFNKLFPMSAAEFAAELADTDVLAQTGADKSLIHYGLRKCDGTTIILVEAPEGQRLVFLPEGSN